VHSAFEQGQSLAWAADLDREPLAVALAAVPLSAANLTTTIAEARKSKYWDMVKAAMETEIRGKFVENQAWTMVPRTSEVSVIKSKWVLKFTLGKDGSVEKVKTRLVACGYGQKQGIDYTHVFAATLPATSLRTLLATIAARNLDMDEKTRSNFFFTQEFVDAEIFVECPACSWSTDMSYDSARRPSRGSSNEQGAYLWFGKNKRVLTSIGFESSPTEPNIDVHRDARIIIGVFADDILVGYHPSCADLYMRIKRQHSEKIKIGELQLQTVTEFIGIEISRDRTDKPARLQSLSQGTSRKPTSRTNRQLTLAATRYLASPTGHGRHAKHSTSSSPPTRSIRSTPLSTCAHAGHLCGRPA
jgi:hypothetical protein